MKNLKNNIFGYVKWKTSLGKIVTNKIKRYIPNLFFKLVRTLLFIKGWYLLLIHWEKSETPMGKISKCNTVHYNSNYQQT